MIMANVKKSVSLATGLDLKAMTYVGNESENDSKDYETSLGTDKVGPSELSSQVNSDLVNNESSSVLSNGDQKLSEIDEICENTQKNINGDTGLFCCSLNNELPSNDFRLRMIEKWVSELQNYGCFDDEGAEKDKTVLDSDSPVAKFDEMVSPGKEAVKKYLSSLSATAIFAQLVNRGLAVIPFLSAFTSLRSLDLRGNAITRITGGSLPRGLHILNLSNNNISTIEGLRELTRLRVLDLSYNRLIRVGHGLGSCSSLKELYLGGNKIGEVEGLHRLLKLNVLDLRFNKISTTKCLRQLAANYNLQAINLEGNPAEKHVGDEQLKKYLQGLLPHLTFFNRQSIRVGALNNSTDLPARLRIGSGHRKGTRSHGSSSHRVSSSKVCKSRCGRPPPKATKRSSHRHHYHGCDVSKVTSFMADLSVRRSQSEANLGAF